MVRVALHAKWRSDSAAKRYAPLVLQALGESYR